MKAAIAAIKGLADVTGTNLLARCMVPVDSPYAAGISSEEAANGVHTNSSAGWIWVGNTSRDEYSGALFGLTVAYDMVDDAAVKGPIAALVTRLIDFLNGNNWSVVMPDGSSSTSFLVRPDQIETFLAIGRHVNSDHFTSVSYETQRVLLAPTVPAPIGVDTASDDSYFKFNLDYIDLYDLIRLEASSAKTIYRVRIHAVARPYRAAPERLLQHHRSCALTARTRRATARRSHLLDAWLLRLRRDFGVDLTSVVPVCGDQACQPVPVWLRPPTISCGSEAPSSSAVGGAGIIESAGIDYILPYWMARYYGLQESIVVQSAAAPDCGSGAAVARIHFRRQPGIHHAKSRIAAAAGFARRRQVTVQDSAGTSAAAPLLYVSPGQINFLMPAGMATGVATFTIAGGPSGALTAIGAVGQVAPALFSLNGAGTGLAAATAIRVNAGDPSLQSPVTLFDCSSRHASPCPSTSESTRPSI